MGMLQSNRCQELTTASVISFLPLSGRCGVHLLYSVVTSNRYRLCIKDEQRLFKISFQRTQHLCNSHWNFCLQCCAWEGFGVFLWPATGLLPNIHGSAIFYFICFTNLDGQDLSESLEIYMCLYMCTVLQIRKQMQIYPGFVVSHYQGSCHQSAVGCICVNRWRLVRLLP